MSLRRAFPGYGQYGVNDPVNFVLGACMAAKFAYYTPRFNFQARAMRAPEASEHEFAGLTFGNPLRAVNRDVDIF